MEPKAEAGCVLKVDVQCDECKIQLMKILRSISGVYDVTIEAEQGIAKVVGEVEPNTLLWALSKSGKHAELVRLTMIDPRMNRYANYDRYSSSSSSGDRCYGYNDYGYSYGYDAIGDSHVRGLPQRSLGYEPGQSYEYRDANYSGRYLPPAQHVPSYPAVPVDEYEDAYSTSSCTII